MGILKYTGMDTVNKLILVNIVMLSLSHVRLSRKQINTLPVRFDDTVSKKFQIRLYPQRTYLNTCLFQVFFLNIVF
jgi:hypothetical protein